MAATADGYKGVASAVKMCDGADEALCCLCICCCGLMPILVTLLCQMYSKNIPGVQGGASTSASNQQSNRVLTGSSCLLEYAGKGFFLLRLCNLLTIPLQPEQAGAAIHEKRHACCCNPEE